MKNNNELAKSIAIIIFCIATAAIHHASLMAFVYLSNIEGAIHGQLSGGEALLVTAVLLSMAISLGCATYYAIQLPWIKSVLASDD